MSRRSSKTIYKNLAITTQEKKIGEEVLKNYEVGGDIYVNQLRARMRHLEVAKKWSLYYAMERSIKYAMAKMEASNEQWPLALLD